MLGRSYRTFARALRAFRSLPRLGASRLALKAGGGERGSRSLRPGGRCGGREGTGAVATDGREDDVDATARGASAADALSWAADFEAARVTVGTATGGSGAAAANGAGSVAGAGAARACGSASESKGTVGAEGSVSVIDRGALSAAGRPPRWSVHHKTPITAGGTPMTAPRHSVNATRERHQPVSRRCSVSERGSGVRSIDRPKAMGLVRVATSTTSLGSGRATAISFGSGVAGGKGTSTRARARASAHASAPGRALLREIGRPFDLGLQRIGIRWRRARTPRGAELLAQCVARRAKTDGATVEPGVGDEPLAQGAKVGREGRHARRAMGPVFGHRPVDERRDADRAGGSSTLVSGLGVACNCNRATCSMAPGRPALSSAKGCRPAIIS